MANARSIAANGHQPLTRPLAMGTRCMVASSHYLASQAGAMMLQNGGSAVDACIAANGVLCVVYNHMAGLGGDVFAQVWDPSRGNVAAINGSGRSAAAATIDFYKSKAVDEIPQRGPLAALTVPGVVDGWMQLHERYGRLPWRDLFRPAIAYARDGFPISMKFSDYIREKSDVLRAQPAAAAVYLPHGKAPAPGDRFVQVDLARTLETLAARGGDDFYRGELCARIVRGVEQAGGILTADDFDRHRSDWVDPLRTTYRGYEVTELPPNTQGIATLLILNLIEDDDIARLGTDSADYYHLVTEAVKLAFADRDEWVTDPEAIDIPYDRLLDKGYARGRRRKIDMAEAAPVDDVVPGIERGPGGNGRRPDRSARGGDTVYLCAVDTDGMACSLIQSVYFEFGSAFMPDGTGVLLQNRGSFFKLDPDHPNALAPEKRTFHTIIPAMMLRDGKPALIFGSMGGEGQPQTQTALVTRIVDEGRDVQAAIEAPRWLYGRTWGEESKALKLEGRIPDGVAAELARRGHKVQMTEDWSQSMGHAQAIWIDRERGILCGGADPRGDGVAVGW